MSVVLMRMKNIPKNCCACELRCHDPLTGEDICPKTGRECLSTGRDALCPIIGVLPDTHGRLVDADDAFAQIVKRSIKGYISNTGVYAALQEASTIVPAGGCGYSSVFNS